MTPYELGIYANAFVEKLTHKTQYAYQLAAVNAFLTSRWVWAKNVNIEKHLAPANNKPKPSGEADMSDEQMLAAVRSLTAKFDGSGA